jgi:hypothetical protein
VAVSLLVAFTGTGVPQPAGALQSAGAWAPAFTGVRSPGGTPPPGGPQMVLAALNNSVGQSFQVTAMSDVGHRRARAVPGDDGQAVAG